jgi:hypothetical protein
MESYGELSSWISMDSSMNYFIKLFMEGRISIVPNPTRPLLSRIIVFEWHATKLGKSHKPQRWTRTLANRTRVKKACFLHTPQAIPPIFKNLDFPSRRPVLRSSFISTIPDAWMT